MQLTAIVIDDEESARETLSGMIRLYAPEINIIGEAGSVNKGIEEIRSKKPDVVFLDVRITAGTSFDILDGLDTINFGIVFTTAYDSYALKAIKFSALDYLLKPINPDELVIAVEKLKANLGDSDQTITNQNLELFNENLKKTEKEFSRIALPSSNGLIVTDIKEIVRCEGYKNYTTFYLINKQQIVVCKTLKEFQQMLEGHGFFRIFQSHLVNLQFIKGYIKGRGGMVEMKDGTQLPVSREKKSELLIALKEPANS